MNRINELIKEYCPDGVEIRSLEDCCNLLDKKRKPITKASREAGKYPYYGANGIQDYVANYIFDGMFVLVGEDGSVITKSGTPVVTWAEGKIWVNNHAHIIEEKDGIMLRYLYHYLQTIDVTSLIHGNIPKLTGGDFKALQIPIPPLPIQREIVRILDNFTELTKELTKELTARKKQYEFYRDELLTNENTTVLKPLGDICTLVRGPFGGSLKKECFVSDGYAVYEQQHAIYDNFSNFRYFIDGKKYEELKRFSVNPGDMIMSCSGTMGKIAIVPDDSPKGVINQALLKITVGPEVDRKYLKYCFENTVTKQMNDNARGGAIKNVASVAELKQTMIAVPPIETQKRLVKVLDNFDAICSDFNIGLPAEIEARQKQYEYYRDMLLTFAEKGEIIPDRQTDRQTDKQ